jgi:hypothetical protein
MNKKLSHANFEYNLLTNMISKPVTVLIKFKSTVDFPSVNSWSRYIIPALPPWTNSFLPKSTLISLNHNLHTQLQSILRPLLVLPTHIDLSPFRPQPSCSLHPPSTFLVIQSSASSPYPRVNFSFELQHLPTTSNKS